MNKRDAEKTAREITFRVCVLGEYPSTSAELSTMADAMREAGYRMERRAVAGFDGFTIDHDGDLTRYIAAPRKRNPGKKQHCTIYALQDVDAYEAANMALCANDYTTAETWADRIGSASLRNEIIEGLDHLDHEIRNGKACNDNNVFVCPPSVKLDELEQVRACLDYPEGVEVTQKRPGCCIWVSGDTRPHKEELKAFGFRWSPKKQAWYWKPAA